MMGVSCSFTLFVGCLSVLTKVCILDWFVFGLWVGLWVCLLNLV